MYIHAKHMPINLQVCVYTNTYIYTCVNVCIYTFIGLYAHICTCIHMYVLICIHSYTVLSNISCFPHLEVSNLLKVLSKMAISRRIEKKRY